MSTTQLSYENGAKVAGALLSCDEFDSNERMRNALAQVNDLQPFRSLVKDGGSPQERVQNVIVYLQDKQVHGNRNALAVFLQALARQYAGEDRGGVLQRAARLVEADVAQAGKIEVPYVVVGPKPTFVSPAAK
jgi:hypothetical protein